MLSSTRLRNLEEIGLTVESGYGTSALFKDLHRGLWHELEDKAKTINIDPYRQEIQLAYIAILKNVVEWIKNEGKITHGTHTASNIYNYSNDTRGRAFNALTDIKKAIEKVIKKIDDAPAQAHLELCLLEINKVQKLNQ